MEEREQASIQLASKEDVGEVLILLEGNNLPIEGVREIFENFLVFRDSTRCSALPRIIGCVGLEVYGTAGVFRSLAVHPRSHSFGIGTKLTLAMIEKAKVSGVDELFLLTDTAAPFFEKIGFAVVDRNSAPERIRASIEFSKLCPSSSTCMYLKISIQKT